MKNSKRFLSVALLAIVGLSLPNLLSAQTILTTTTLSAAITTTAQTNLTVTSATGITANSTVLYIADTNSAGEAVFVNSVSGTNIGVTRGYQTLGKARTHSSGAVVFIGPPYAFGYVQPSGSCTRANILYLPDIAFGLEGTATTINDCLGGQWVTSTSGDANTFLRQYAPSTGAVLLSTINTAGTTLSASTMYCQEIDLQNGKYATGLAVLNGTTVGTDKHLVALYDGTGNLLANSATAGATTSGASTYQTFAFTAPYYMVAPAKYYGCTQTNGTTDTVRMTVTGVQDGYTTKGVTGQTFGTVPATFTAPTTFTTAVGPYYQVY